MVPLLTGPGTAVPAPTVRALPSSYPAQIAADKFCMCQCIVFVQKSAVCKSDTPYHARLTSYVQVPLQETVVARDCSNKS
jgi:hypothetical protein